ncbi:MAG: hypothetical protein LBR41_00765 [Rickettsiales bacterium]|jgi:hypothetical protein|nr:hypothetical protein [Rickettsiales bacterium]
MAYNNKNGKQQQVGQMIQRCHRYRQKRKQYMDTARQTPDEVERERLLQMAEHYGRIVSDEQGKIDGTRGGPAPIQESCDADAGDTDDDSFPDFITNL